MKTTLSTLPVGRLDAAEVPLKRLFMGQPVMFELRGHFLPRRLGRNPVLMIVPVSHFVPTAENGLDLVVSVEGRGCWVCSATPAYSVHDFYRGGVPMIVAVELVARLNSLLKELKHGEH